MLNAWLEAQYIAQWEEIPHRVLPGTIAGLIPLGRPFNGFVEHTSRVSPTCLISFERSRYSVSAFFTNRPVPALSGGSPLLKSPLHQLHRSSHPAHRVYIGGRHQPDLVP